MTYEEDKKLISKIAKELNINSKIVFDIHHGLNEHRVFITPIRHMPIRNLTTLKIEQNLREKVGNYILYHLGKRLEAIEQNKSNPKLRKA